MPDSLQSSNEPESSRSYGIQSQKIDTSTLDNLEATKTQSDIRDVDDEVNVIKENAKTIQEKMSCQLGKIDTILNKAENAHYEMQRQSKQMKGLLK